MAGVQKKLDDQIAKLGAMKTEKQKIEAEKTKIEAAKQKFEAEATHTVQRFPLSLGLHCMVAKTLTRPLWQIGEWQKSNGDLVGANEGLKQANDALEQEIDQLRQAQPNSFRCTVVSVLTD